MSERDGGPAFPGPVRVSSFGMTLRDYFAAKAMQAMILDSRARTFSEAAAFCYEFADAMLKEGQMKEPKDAAS